MREETKESEYEKIRKQTNRSMNKVMFVIAILSIPIVFLLKNYMNNNQSSANFSSDSNINWTMLLIYCAIIFALFITYKITAKIRYEKRVHALVYDYSNGDVDANLKLLLVISKEKHNRAIYLPEARPLSNRNYKAEVNELKTFEVLLVNKEILDDKQLQRLKNLILYC